MAAAPAPLQNTGPQTVLLAGAPIILSSGSLSQPPNHTHFLLSSCSWYLLLSQITVYFFIALHSHSSDLTPLHTLDAQTSNRVWHIVGAQYTLSSGVQNHTNVCRTLYVAERAFHVLSPGVLWFLFCPLLTKLRALAVRMRCIILI